MKIEVQLRPPAQVITISGRLDAFTSRSLEEAIAGALGDSAIRYIILDLSKLEYLSSAGIRVFVTTHKHVRGVGGDFFLVGLNGYPEKVLEMAGFGESLHKYQSLSMALAAAGAESAADADWEKATSFTGIAGPYKIAPWSVDRCSAMVLGDVRQVLNCSVTPSLMRSKRFSATEYSIGLGGLGDKLDDYFPIMGEMMTIGGTMVWLPTDGNDTADYFIPQNDTGEVTIRTAFNVSLAGQFNDLALLESPLPEGAAIGDIYRDLFTFARKRRNPFKGGIFVAMRAEVHAAYGAGILRSPIAAHKPANNQPLTDPVNFETWFEVDLSPRHKNVTALFTGFGLDLNSSFASYYDPACLDAAFYINPGNRSASNSQLLHNHGVFFNPLPLGSRPVSLDEEILAVVENGDFRDMRHVFDNTRVTRALIGISYIEQFTPDNTGGA